MFEQLYDVKPEESEVFGLNWCGSTKFEKHTPMLIAKFTKDKDSDGQDVEVYCSAAPARFFTIKALDSTNSVNEINKGFTLETGSGMAVLTKQIAEAISSGMLGIYTENNV
jgi:hypothetical protein